MRKIFVHVWFESSIEKYNELTAGFLWLQFVCLEVCTHASLKDVDAGKTEKTALRYQNYRRGRSLVVLI